MSIRESYKSPFPPHAIDFDIAMYDIASRYDIPELKTYLNLQIHQC